MKIHQFNAEFHEEFLCEAKYLDAADNTATGIILHKAEKGLNGKYTVRIDSASHRIPLHRVLRVTQSSRKWSDL